MADSDESNLEGSDLVKAKKPRKQHIKTWKRGNAARWQDKPTGKRNLVTKSRDWNALELLCEGYSPADVAKRLGYRDSCHLSTQMKNIIERTTFEKVQQYRQLEYMRLEKMYQSLESKAFNGDTKAIETSLKIHDRKAALLGLKAPEQLHITTEDVPVFQITLGNQPILPAIETTAEVIETTEVTNENQEKQIS